MAIVNGKWYADTGNPWMKGIYEQSFPLQRGDNHKIAKIRLDYSKIFSRTTGQQMSN
jgi:hypothetical protein